MEHAAADYDRADEYVDFERRVLVIALFLGRIFMRMNRSSVGCGTMVGA